MTAEETRSILTIALMAAFADGLKDEGERAAVKRVAEALGPEAGFDLPGLYREVLLAKPDLGQVAASLQSQAAGRSADIPVAGMLALLAAEIGARAARIAHGLNGDLSASLIDGESTIGGGSAPGATLPTRLLRLTHARLSAAAVEQRLRGLDPPVIARIENDHVVIDMRTVMPHQDEMLGRLLAQANSSQTGPQ